MNGTNRKISHRGTETQSHIGGATAYEQQAESRV